MTWSIINKGLKKHKWINLVLVFFIMLSICLISTGVIIVIQLFESINNLYDTAKPPHFLQMHTGEVYEEQIEEFAKSDYHVTDWQIMEMTDIDGSMIWVTKPDGGSYSLSDCMLGFSFIEEPEKYDLLLNKDNERVDLAEGEIGVPLILLDSYNIKKGDKITLSDGIFSQTFTVTEFLRDAQMNSTLCSSTRFLLNGNDLQNVHSNIGTTEYIIEFYFDDPSYANEFQTLYENADIACNGQAITYTLLKLVSGLPDLLTVVILILVSILLMFIAGLCLKFTILAVLEEDIEEIGIMKAIGMSFKDIQSIYLGRYRILIITGCVIGYFASLIVNRFLTNHISETFGNVKFSVLNYVLPSIFITVVYLIDISLCKKIMKYIRKVSVIDTIKGSLNMNNGKKSTIKSSHISLNIMNTNMWTAWKDIASHKKSWFLLVFVVMIVECIMLTAVNILNTFESPEFITYMGQNKCDVMITVASADNLNEKYNTVIDNLEKDNNIKKILCEAYTMRSAINKDNEVRNIHIACSDTSEGSLQYLNGRPPEKPDEIAISLLYSEEFAAESGDYITFVSGDTEKKILVSGVYQDVTNGGYTSKMCTSYDSSEIYQYYLMVDFKDNVDVMEKVDFYADIFKTTANVKSMDEFVSQTLSGLTSQFSSVVWIINIVSISLAVLITFLYLMLIMVKDRNQIAIQKVVGFSLKDIRLQYVYKIILCSILGMILGILFVQLIGEAVISLIISMINMGISNITFIINPLQVFIIYPLILLAFVLTSACICTLKIRNDVQLSQLIKG